MIAVLNFDGRQFKVEEKQELFINKISGKKGDKLTLKDILLIQKSNDITVGSPTIEGANVTISILEHTKDKKIIVFKKKRRKGYKVKNGHRQMLTKIRVETISSGTDGNKKTTAKKTTAKKTTAKKTTAKKTTK